MPENHTDLDVALGLLAHLASKRLTDDDLATLKSKQRKKLPAARVARQGPAPRAARLRRRVIVVALAAVLVAASAAVASSLLRGGPAEEELSSLAKDGHLSRAAAAQELRDEHRIAAFADRAREQLGAAFGGVYVSPAPHPQVTVALVRGAPTDARETFRRLLAEAGFERPVAVVNVQHSEADLVALQRQIEGEVAPLNAAAPTTIDVEVDLPRNRVVVHPAGQPSAAQQRFIASLPGSRGSSVVVDGPTPQLQRQPKPLDAGTSRN